MHRLSSQTAQTLLNTNVCCSDFVLAVVASAGCVLAVRRPRLRWPCRLDLGGLLDVSSAVGITTCVSFDMGGCTPDLVCVALVGGRCTGSSAPRFSRPSSAVRLRLSVPCDAPVGFVFGACLGGVRRGSWGRDSCLVARVGRGLCCVPEFSTSTMSTWAACTGCAGASVVLFDVSTSMFLFVDSLSVGRTLFFRFRVVPLRLVVMLVSP